MQIIFLIFELLFTYVITPIVCFQIISGCTKRYSNQPGLLLAYCLGFGPLTISWMLALLLWIAPHHNPNLYVWFINILFLSLDLLMFRQLKRLKGAAIDCFGFFNRHQIGIVGILLMLFSMALYLPLKDHGQLGYFSLARILAHARTVGLYPMLDAQKTGGMVTHWTHPLGFVSLYVWHYFINSTLTWSWPIRLVSPFFAFTTILVLWNKLKYHSMVMATTSVFLMITVPLYFHEAATCHLDSYRIFTFLLAFFVLSDVVEKPSVAEIGLVGYSLGLCLFSHSLGLLAVPMLITYYLIFSDFPVVKRFVSGLFILLIGFAFVVPRYVVNYHHFHSIIHDLNPVWQLTVVDYKNTINQIRNISTPYQIWIFGFLKGFSKVMMFGASYWLLFLGVFKYRKIRPLSDNPVFQAVFVVLFFYFMVYVSLKLGMNQFIKDDRYIMTIQPFIAILGAYGISQLGLNWRRLNTLFVFLTIPLILYFSVNIWEYDLKTFASNRSDLEKLISIKDSHYPVIDYVKLAVPNKSRVLVFSQNEIEYYVPEQNFVSHLDTMLLDVYQASTLKEAYERLKAHNIEYILVPSQKGPVYLNTFISKLVKDSNYSEFLYESGKSQIYRLK